jgi:hypothetical protein
MGKKIGEIIDANGDGLWEVFLETDGTITVECDALNGSEDEFYTCVSDLEVSLSARGYRYRDYQRGTNIVL